MVNGTEHQPKIKAYASIINYNGDNALMIKAFVRDKNQIKEITQEIIKNNCHKLEIELLFFRKLNAIVRLKEAKLL